MIIKSTKTKYRAFKPVKGNNGGIKRTQRNKEKRERGNKDETRRLARRTRRGRIRRSGRRPGRGLARCAAAAPGPRGPDGLQPPRPLHLVTDVSGPDASAAASLAFWGRKRERLRPGAAGAGVSPAPRASSASAPSAEHARPRSSRVSLALLLTPASSAPLALCTGQSCRGVSRTPVPPSVCPPPLRLSQPIASLADPSAGLWGPCRPLRTILCTRDGGF